MVPDWLAAAAAWLGETPVAGAMRDGVWLYPLVETLHIIGFAILVGAVAMFDLRVLGCARHLSIHALGRHLLRWAMRSLLLIVPAGLLLFATQPEDFLSNPTFGVKLGLIATAGLNALVFHTDSYRGVATWDVATRAPLRARAHALVSLLLWFGVIGCGRLLAYT